MNLNIIIIIRFIIIKKNILKTLKKEQITAAAVVVPARAGRVRQRLRSSSDGVGSTATEGQVLASDRDPQ